ncbi:MAG: hypothetical protein GC181_04600 [Bacteroidetes bacterium]|nr:hypothetical protein [Bacteroidota bacterium]
MNQKFILFWLIFLFYAATLLSCGSPSDSSTVNSDSEKTISDSGDIAFQTDTSTPIKTIDSVINNKVEIQKTKNSPKVKWEKAELLIRNRKKIQIHFCINEMVWTERRADSSFKPVSFHDYLFKLDHSILPAVPWLNTIYVPTDSVENWMKKYRVSASFVRGEFAGGLSNYFTIYYSRRPTLEEIKQLTELGLMDSQNRDRPNVNYYDTLIFSSVKIPFGTVSEIIRINKQLKKLDFVDWVENEIFTGEPIPLDSDDV